jgi:hypothetical protein
MASRRRRIERSRFLKSLELAGKLVGVRHHHPLDKDRNHRDVPTKSSSGFHSDKVFRIAESPSAPIVGAIKPPLSDHYNEYVAAAHCTVDCLSEILARIKSRDFHEHLILPEVFL